MGTAVSVVTGGLGFIGQALVKRLKDQGEEPVIIDVRDIPSQVAEVSVMRGSIDDALIWKQLFRIHGPIRTVFHCAGLIQVSESVEQPHRYFQENLVASLAMLNHLRSYSLVPLIFSSSAAVYGAPLQTPIPETAPLMPLSPYGVTKRQFEEVLRAYHQAFGQPYVALRYFNVAGSLNGVHENHSPESHLLPRVADALAQGRSPVIYGSDYPTADGTAVRDYVHIADLVDGHLAARDYLERGGASTEINLGAGRGTSVLEMIQAFSRMISPMPHPQYGDRRPGDPAILVARIDRSQKLLGWSPRRSQIDRIVREVWEQRSRFGPGFEAS